MGSSSATRSLRIGIAHPRLGRGGSEAVALRLLAVLGAEHEVTLITTGEVDWGALNAFYGLALDPARIAVLRPWLPAPLARTELAAAARAALHQRFARRVAGRFDLLVSAYNPLDFGRPTLHFVADFSWDPAFARRYDPPPPGLRGRLLASPALHGGYAWVARHLGAPSPGGAVGADDVVVANSRYVAAVLRVRHGVSAPVVYPPVDVDFPVVPWEARAARFVSVGRVAPEKRLERLIRVVAGVRARGHEVALHLGGDFRGSAYGAEIARLAERAGPWVVLTGPVFGAEKAALLSSSRYGLHGREGEPFGIAVAELMAAGCVPFVPEVGGAAEIVSDAALVYADEATAVAKIDALLRAPAATATALAERLRARAQGFAAGRFDDEVRALVARFMGRAS